MRSKLQQAYRWHSIIAVLSLLAVCAAWLVAGHAQWPLLLLYIHAALVSRFLQRRAKGLDAHLYNFSIRKDLPADEQQCRDALVYRLCVCSGLIYCALPVAVWWVASNPSFQATADGRA